MSGRQSDRSGLLHLTGLVARREYLRTVRRRGYLFGTLLLPLGIAVLMGVSVFFSTEGFSGDSAGHRHYRHRQRLHRAHHRVHDRASLATDAG